MKYRLISLACVLGMSAVLFTGCTANDGVGTRSTNRGNNALGVNPNATTINGSGRSVYRNLSAADGHFRSGTSGTSMYGASGYSPSGNGTTGMSGTGTGTAGLSGSGTSGSTSAYGNDNNGLSGTDRNRDVLVLGNLIIVGTDANNTNTNGSGNGAAAGGSFGRSGNTNGTGGLGTTGSRSAASNGRVTSGSTGVGNGMATTSATGTSGSALWSDDLQVLQTQFGQTFRVMKVTDRKAVEAIHRVKRILSSDASIRAKTSTILNDLPYILKNASQVTTNNRAGNGMGSSAGAGSFTSGAGAGMGTTPGTSTTGAGSR